MRASLIAFEGLLHNVHLKRKYVRSNVRIVGNVPLFLLQKIISQTKSSASSFQHVKLKLS